MNDVTMNTVKPDDSSVIIWECYHSANTGEIRFIERTKNRNKYYNFCNNIFPSPDDSTLKRC